ncbi:hypothetical protein KC19_12G074300 [Ceratodon purpureus]|uniref:Uncharacterized protein n=1 Tax=Ceratodon purpureus TaxID=3225 RepID=A0A8T0G4N3_CERPU|nr:hypothetical protein KC19_12G074300 [Ceratodon purpureus]
MATSSAKPLELEMDQEQRSSDHVRLHIQELVKRLDELPDQEERLRLEAEGKTVTDVAEALLPFSYLEAQNLLAIEKDPVLKLTLANLKEKERLLSSRVFDCKCRIERAKDVAYWVIAFSFVVQGLNLLIATPKGACAAGTDKESRTYLVFLSIVACLLTSLIIAKELKIISISERIRWSEEQSLKEVVKSRLELSRSGINYQFKDNHYKLPERRPRHSSDLHFIGASLILCTWVFPVVIWRVSK